MEMANTFLTLGVLLLLGLLMDTLGRLMHLPRVSLLLLFGFLVGPSVLDLMPEILTPWFSLLTNMALAMIGFLIGGKLTSKTLREHGRLVLIISIIFSLFTTCFVCLMLFLMGFPLSVSVLLGVMASATAPATTTDVIHELGVRKAFSRILIGVVAFGEILALFFFSFAFIVINSSIGASDMIHFFYTAIWNVVGAILIGGVIGVPSAFLTGRVRAGEPIMIEALGIVFIATGLALYVHASFLLTTMIVGVVVANLAHHHKRPFHAIENIDAPFLILFFILAGASLNLRSLHEFGLFGVGYIIFRAIAVVFGGWFGGFVAQAESRTSRWIGVALMPQGGMVLGMALIASQAFPQIKSIMLPVILMAVIVFELLGPLMTRYALLKVSKPA